MQLTIDRDDDVRIIILSIIVRRLLTSPGAGPAAAVGSYRYQRHR